MVEASAPTTQVAMGDGAGKHLGRWRASIVVVILLVPMVVDPWGFHAHVALRWTALSLAVAAGAALSYRELWSIDIHVRRAWLLLLTSALVSTVVAIAPMDAIIGDGGRRGGLLTLLLIAGTFAIGAAGSRWLWLLARAAALAIAALAIAIGWQLRRPEVGLATSQDVFVGNSGQLGGYLVVLCGLSYVLARDDPDRSWRRLGWPALGIGIVSLALTGSHAAVAGLVAATAVAVTLETRGEVGAHGSRRGPFAVVGVLLALGLTIVALSWASQFRAIRGSVVGRLDTWQQSLDVIAARPMFGWGAEGFRHGFAQFVDDDFVARYGDERVQDRAHMLLLDHAGATGIIGALALVWLTVAIVRAIDLRSGDRRRLLPALVGGGVFLVGWFPEFELAAVLALIAGILVGSTADAGVAHRSSAPGPVGYGLTVMTATVATACVLVGSITVVEDRRLRESLDSYFAVARSAPKDDAQPWIASPSTHPLIIASRWPGGFTELLAAAELIPRTDPSELRAAVAAIDRAPRWRSAAWDAEVAYVRAELLLELARRDGDRRLLLAAERQFIGTLELAPTHRQAWRGLGRARLLAEDPAATEAFERLAELRPGEVGPLYELALAELQRGGIDAAVAAVDRACAIDAGDPQLQELVRAVEGSGRRLPSCS